MRYNRLHDIGLTDDEIKKNLLFTGDKVGDPMKTALDPKQAKDWFGAPPPDLSVIARSRAEVGKGSGADYLYTLLAHVLPRRRQGRPAGTTSPFPNVGMPHALWQLQGEQRAKFVEAKDPHEEGKTLHQFAGFEQITPGTLTGLQYDEAVGDLVAFPAMDGRAGAGHATVRIGVGVLHLPRPSHPGHLASERIVLAGHPLVFRRRQHARSPERPLALLRGWHFLF